MLNWPQEPAAAGSLPRTLRYCKICQRDTPHEIRSGAGVIVRICVACLERTLRYELERD
ncbi:MAG TPA: hypothetical protein VMS37_22570 [Verrucomicrobiae bacterium]|nr:hypothetical protein [Verrucomicrobiae bacterium]